MNEFVNMGKRSIELPAGCKDLIDVLQPAKRHALAKLTISLAEGGLADLAKHLANLLVSCFSRKWTFPQPELVTNS